MFKNPDLKNPPKYPGLENIPQKCYSLSYSSTMQLQVAPWNLGVLFLRLGPLQYLAL